MQERAMGDFFSPVRDGLFVVPIRPENSPELRSYSVRSQGLFCSLMVSIDWCYRIYYHSLGFRKGRSRLLDPACDELLVLGQCLCLPFFVLATGNGGKLIIVPALNG